MVESRTPARHHPSPVNPIQEPNLILNALREGLGRAIAFVDVITRPNPLQRAPELQRQVEAQARDLSLYQFYACPFCIKTRRALHRLNLPVETRDAQHDPVHRAALEDGGGKVQVPCLRIDGQGDTRWLYESKEIIAYLDHRFAKPEGTA
jgi:glutaredoxin